MSTEEIIANADAVQAQLKYHEVKPILETAYNGGNTNPEIAWRLSRNCYDLAQETTDKAVKEQLIRRGLEIIEKCVQDDGGNNFASQKWKGILLGGLGEFIGSKEKIGNAFLIRDFFKKAIELNPKDATSQHCMGKWCWSILQIGWLERQAAAVLFATPPTSTYDECRGYFLASDEIERTIHNCIALGDLYYQEKNWNEAKKWFGAALALPASTENQKRQHEDATKKLASC